MALVSAANVIEMVAIAIHAPGLSRPGRRFLHGS